jgi:hypothetical protein
MTEQDSSKDPAKQTGSQPNPVEPLRTYETPVVPSSHPANKEENHAKEDKAKWTDKTMAFFTVFLFLAAVIQAVIFFEQWREMHDGGIDTHALSETAKQQACAASKSAQAARDFSNTADLINKGIADAVKKLDAQVRATQNGLENEQRPWLKLELTGKPSTDPKSPDKVQFDLTVGGPLQIPMSIANLGKTPTEKTISIFFVEVVDAGKEPHIPQIGHRVISVPHFSGTIFPGDKAPVSAIRFLDSPIGTPWKLEPLTPPEANALAEKRAYIAVYGVTKYEDIFHFVHKTHMCRDFYISGEDAGSVLCTLSNTVEDKETKHQR